jgi:serine protease AprX
MRPRRKSSLVTILSVGVRDLDYMTVTPRLLSVRLGLSLLIGFSTLGLLAAAPAEAQHRARMPQALDAALSQGASGYHDVVIVTPQAEVDRLAAAYGVRVISRLDMGAVLSGTSGQIDALAGDANVGALALNDVVFSTMAVTTQATGANQLWQARGSTSHFDGLTGAGVGVVIIDSGIAPHPDVASRLLYSLDLTDEEGLADGYGHGTHVAATVAGSGSGSRSIDGTAYVGMAPGATLISVKVLGSDGTGYVASVIAAIEWSIRNRARLKIRVLNLSLGHEATSLPQDDPMAAAVERAVAAGLVVVSSAGNRGKDENGIEVERSIVSPGHTPGALTVGALNTRGTVERSDDLVATYSSRGPVGDKDAAPSTWRIKPDLVAPGNAIVAAGAEGSYLWDNYPSRRVMGASGGTYLNLSGASMATAVVSGAVAQLLQLEPGLTPAEVKFALQFTAGNVADLPLSTQGAGSLNVALAAELVKRGDVAAAPATSLIGGEVAEGGMVAFGPKVSVTGSGVVLGGNTLIWGARGGPVGGDTLIWGARGGPVGGDTLIWGARGGPVGGD